MFCTIFNFQTRSREEFLELFYVKYQESIDRIIEKQTKKKAELDSRFDDLGKRLLIYAKKITEGKQ